MFHFCFYYLPWGFLLSLFLKWFLEKEVVTLWSPFLLSLSTSTPLTVSSAM